ncbi:MAG: hypothetical protein ABW060_03495 [Solirubrobacteraceae bacterium]
MHLRHTVLTACAIALLAAPAATARNSQPDPPGPVLAPAGGKLLGEAWARGLASPLPDPYAGTCAPVARGGTVVAGHFGDDGTATCSIARHTSVLLFWGFFCSDVFEGVSGEAAQRECAIAGDQTVQAINVSIDGARTVNIRRPRYEALSPQRTVQLGDGSGPITFVAHGWATLIRNLRPGEHTIDVEVVDAAYQFNATLFVTVSRRAH